MFEEIPLIYMNVKILKFWSFLFEKNWRRYLCLPATTFLVFTQFVYMFKTKEGIDSIIRNSYMLVLWFNTILRAYIMIYDNDKYQQVIHELVELFYDLKKSKDDYVKDLLLEVNSKGIIMARGNLFLGLLTCIGFGVYPSLAVDRVLPFGSIIPGINEYSSPFYELWYIFEMCITPIGCCMYIPYTSLIVSFILFGVVMSKTLQHRLRTLHRIANQPKLIHAEIISCIKYQKRIINFIEAVNGLCTFIFLLEFLAFGALLCALLFLLIIVNSSGQAIIVCAYIIMILAQISALYWYANELRQENFAIAAAAYETDWFTYDTIVQKDILLVILRAQKPCSIKVGNFYPMTMELFQSLLNASYTYFTLLKRVYD
uniref:Odorant receptor n=1 Tax=Glossina morsitans morsitans TaxID=37546 RepID=A0A240SWV3_GLOMM